MTRTYTCKVFVCKNEVERWGQMCVLHTKQRNYISDGGMNDVIKSWQDKTPERTQTVASPSTLTECPRVVWLKKQKVPIINERGWGQKQRNMLGRVAENLFAKQLKDEDKLLWHWKDDTAEESVKFGMGEGLTRIEGTPDLLIKLDDKVLISDSKTSRADSFTYVSIENPWEDELWYKYKLQVEAYYLLCHKNKDWFKGEKFTVLASQTIPKGGVPPHTVGQALYQHRLPLPEACHLFSYALDDGVVKRDITWIPTKETADEVLKYVKRWNNAYQSETIPNCKCSETQIKFCDYATETERTGSGYKLGVKCCGDEIYEKFKEGKT